MWLNDNEPFVVDWLRNLIAAGHLPPGVVNDQSIREITKQDLKGYSQAHFFAGIGGWPLALKLAGWSADRPVWTGSCPCQPFSVAGRRVGVADERHLWPEWFRLIKECRPPVIFGEQVASKDGYAWFDIVQADLESLGYACGMVVSPAAGYGAPHIRHRIYFVANASVKRRGTRRGANKEGEGTEQFGRSCTAGIVADARGTKWRQKSGGGQNEQYGTNARWEEAPSRYPMGGPLGGFWSDAEWLPCTDGKARPTQPGIFPLAHGVPARVGRLCAYGNAIVPQAAVEFIRAYMEIVQQEQEGGDSE